MKNQKHNKVRPATSVDYDKTCETRYGNLNCADRKTCRFCQMDYPQELLRGLIVSWGEEKIQGMACPICVNESTNYDVSLPKDTAPTDKQLILLFRMAVAFLKMTEQKRK